MKSNTNKEKFLEMAKYWENIDSKTPSMDREKLYDAIKDYITANDTCALATAAGEFVRATPIEYVFYQDKFYIFTEGGLKFKALAENNHVAIAVFDKFQGFNKLKGLQVMGTANLVEFNSDKYREVAGVKRLNLEALAKRQHMLHLLEITPYSMDFINADFKALGENVRQHYDC